MNDLTKLSNEQLGDFIQISLIHGTNTQFSYELLHEVASRLKHTDEIIKAGINYALKNQDIGTIKPLSFTLDEVAQALGEVLAENANENNDETKEAVEIITDLMAYEAMDKEIKDSAKGDSWVFDNSKYAEEVIINPVNENDEDITEELLAEKIAIQDQMAARKAKKKEKPTVKDSLTVEPSVQEEVQETPAAPSITADDLKAKALEMRQKNTVSAADIKSKLSDLGATTILTLDPSNYNEFNAFLESYNV